MRVYQNAIEMIGHTPMLQLHRFDTGPCELFLKLEYTNPGGSIKDRIGLSMIEQAEKRGDLKPGGTIVEATAGNTGLGLALVAAQKGYRLILVLPDKMSQEKIFNLRAMGAEVVLTRSDVAQGPPGVLPGSRRVDRRAHRRVLHQPVRQSRQSRRRTKRRPAPEIWEQMSQRLDAVVLGVGSSGTIGGLAALLQEDTRRTSSWCSPIRRARSSRSTSRPAR